jgi:hypothetical protein
MANGMITVTLDMGATPVTSGAQAISGLTGITAAGVLEPFIMSKDTTPLGNGHTEDEHGLVGTNDYVSLWVPQSTINAGAGTASLRWLSKIGPLTGKWNVAIPWNG